MKIKEVYKIIVDGLKSSGIKSPEIDSQVLIEFTTGKTREFLLVNPNHELSDDEIRTLDGLLERRKKYQPIAYITGHKEFYGSDFIVTPDVLIPRPETEIIVEESLKFAGQKNHLRILDIGTGSGNIIISLAKNIEADFTATDISEKALAIAKKNMIKHKTKINFIQSDLFINVSGKFDLVVANLPYVPVDGSDDLEIKHEPQGAIFADDDGMEIIKKFLTDVKTHINNDGMILAEVDPRNAKELEKFAKKYFSKVSTFKDYSNKFRALKILT